jgi:hypothetical protein
MKPTVNVLGVVQLACVLDGARDRIRTVNRLPFLGGLTGRGQYM